MTPHPLSRARNGFTLTEVLTCIVIMTILAALLYPTVRGAYESSRQAACLNSLRQIAPIFHGYAAEHNGGVKFMRDGSGAMWYSELRKYANLSEEAAKNAFACPKLPGRDVDAWYCYGMRLGYLTPLVKDDPGVIERPSPGGPATYGFKLVNVKEPHRFFLMSDSTTSSGRQSFRIADRKLYSGGGIKLRHGGKANVLFLDGHVESLDAKGLFALNFLQVLDNDMKVINAQ